MPALQVHRWGAILTVVPHGLAPRRHYGHAAVAMALTLWAIAGESAATGRTSASAAACIG